MQTTIHSLIVDDWAPHIEKTVRLIAIPVAAVYVAGYMAGEWLAQLTDAFTALTCPQAPAPAAEPVAAPAPVIVQRCAVQPVVARCGIQAPDPMAKAVAAVTGGMSQAAAARRYGVSRSTLRRRVAR